MKSGGEHSDCLTHALDNLFIVAIFFGASGLERRTQTNFEFERRLSNERASDSFQHVRRFPVIGEAFNEEPHDGRSWFAGCQRRTRVAGVWYLLLQIGNG